MICTERIATADYLKIEQKGLLWLLHINVRRRDYCWVSLKTLAKRSGKSVNWVVKHLRELQRLGLIWQRVIRIRGKGGLGTLRFINWSHPLLSKNGTDKATEFEPWVPDAETQERAVLAMLDSFINRRKLSADDALTIHDVM